MRYKVYLAHTIKVSNTDEKRYTKEVMSNFNVSADAIKDEDIVNLALRDGADIGEADTSDFKM